MEEPNLDYLRALAGDDAEFRNRFTDILKKELPQEQQAYETAYAGKEFEMARQMVHKLKHKISILGLQEGYALAETYEESLRNGNDALHPRFVEILDRMQRFLNTL